MRDLREKATRGSRTPNTAPDATPDIIAPEAGRHAGHEAGHKSEAPDMRPDARVLAAERESAMLREALQRERANADQWRAQVEAANRDAAELRAALREALRAMPKAIEAREYSQVAQDAPQQPKTTSADTKTTGTGKRPSAAARRDARPLWKVVLGVR